MYMVQSSYVGAVRQPPVMDLAQYMIKKQKNNAICDVCNDKNDGGDNSTAGGSRTAPT